MSELDIEKLENKIAEVVRTSIDGYFQEKIDKNLIIPVDKIGFSVRTMNVFKDNGIETTGDIVLLGVKGLKKLRNMGSHCIEEVKYQLSELNLTLK